ncbi:MAG: hypothetical protein ACFFAO_20000, partial [Candidatus Hermodarchaeota archaeon]
IISKEKKKYISTPNIIIPIKELLIKEQYFIEYFYDHDVFSFSEINYLETDELKNALKSSYFIYNYYGTLEEFQKIIKIYADKIIGNNVIINIPFSIPTTIINHDFTKKEIEHYLDVVVKILEQFPEINFSLSVRIFEYLELFNLYISIISKYENIKILNFTDVFDNFSKYRKILQVINRVKKELDNNIVIMASGKIIPKFFPILIYLGIDLIDCSYLLYLSSENFYDTIEYLLP